VTLKEARETAREARKLIRAGLDPIDERRKEQCKASVPSFAECTIRFLQANKTAWHNAKHRQQWHNTLATYAFPFLGEKPVNAVGVEDVPRVIEPLWTNEPETASRVRGRLERVLDWARARGFREGENPARWRGHLDALLPKPSQIRVVRHHAALPWQEIPAFVAASRQREGIGARALEFTILTAARSGEVRGMKWCEVNGNVWTVPAERMKARREHRVPLSGRCVEILNDLPRLADSDLVFPGTRRGRPLSDMSLSAVVKRMGYHGTVHGFRSSFRDWAAESTSFSREVIEEALAHVVVNKVEAAYRRGDLFEKRRRLMEAWRAYCERSPQVRVLEFPA